MENPMELIHEPVLTEESAVTKVQALTLCFSCETLTIVDNLSLTLEQKHNVDAIITAIKHHISGHIMNQWSTTNCIDVYCNQESFADYLVALQELTKICNFCSNECPTKNIRDQIIEGISDADTVECLLQHQNLKLDAAITTCRAQEAAKNQCREIIDSTPGAVL